MPAGRSTRVSMGRIRSSSAAWQRARGAGCAGRRRAKRSTAGRSRSWCGRGGVHRGVGDGVSVLRHSVVPTSEPSSSPRRSDRLVGCSPSAEPGCGVLGRARRRRRGESRRGPFGSLSTIDARECRRESRRCRLGGVGRGRRLGSVGRCRMRGSAEEGTRSAQNVVHWASGRGRGFCWETRSNTETLHPKIVRTASK